LGILYHIYFDFDLLWRIRRKIHHVGLEFDYFDLFNKYDHGLYHDPRQFRLETTTKYLFKLRKILEIKYSKIICESKRCLQSQKRCSIFDSWERCSLVGNFDSKIIINAFFRISNIASHGHSQPERNGRMSRSTGIGQVIYGCRESIRNWWT
jgi:hypothetical protein